MSEPQRELSDKFRRKLVLRQSLRYTVAAMLMWIVYGAKVAFNVDLFALLHDRAQADTSPQTLLMFALAATILCIIIAVIQVRKSLHLARYGVEAEGKISSFGIAYRGLRHTECQYTFGKATHSFKWSDSTSSGRSVGDPVPLLVDPADPGRCMLKEKIFDVPQEEEPQTTWTKFRDRALIGVAIVGLPFLVWQRWPNAAPKAVSPVVAAPAPQAAPPVDPQPVFKSKFTPPPKEALFQPMFVWENAEPTMQGTGFFVKALGGRVAAVTSAHFLPTDGPRLLEARWLNIADEKPVAVFKTSWGRPGHAGVDYVRGMVVSFVGGRTLVHNMSDEEKKAFPAALTGEAEDDRPDHLMLPVPEGFSNDFILELDTREKPLMGERV